MESDMDYFIALMTEQLKEFKSKHPTLVPFVSIKIWPYKKYGDHYKYIKDKFGFVRKVKIKQGTVPIHYVKTRETTTMIKTELVDSNVLTDNKRKKEKKENYTRDKEET